MVEQACLCFEVEKGVSGSFGVRIAGGIDQDAAQNPFRPGDSGIFIASVEPNAAAETAGASKRLKCTCSAPTWNIRI